MSIFEKRHKDSSGVSRPPKPGRGSVMAIAEDSPLGSFIKSLQGPNRRLYLNLALFLVLVALAGVAWFAFWRESPSGTAPKSQTRLLYEAVLIGYSFLFGMKARGLFDPKEKALLAFIANLSSDDSTKTVVISETWNLFDSFEFGDTIYPLKTPLAGHIDGSKTKGFFFRVESLPFIAVGTGPTKDAAFLDWCEKLHIKFQVLHKKLPMDFDMEDEEAYEGLTRAIDVEKYEAKNPFVIRQIGKIVGVGEGPWKVQWADRTEEVKLVNTPANFSRFAPGQWFEAVVARTQGTRALEKIRHVEMIEPLEFESPAKMEDFLKSLSSTANRPSVDRDWTSR